MSTIFKWFARDTNGSAAIDKIVLLAGLVLLTISVVLKVTDNSDAVTENTAAWSQLMSDFPADRS